MNYGEQRGVVEQKDAILDEEVRGQGVFVSQFKHGLDSKRRLTIPSQWRAQVGSPKSLYVLPDIQHKCLCVFPSSEITHRLGRIRQYPIGDTKAREFARVLAAQSDLISWDSQGRIRIKDELLAFAQIEDEVVLVGAFDRFELWNPEQLKKAGGLDQSKLADAAKYVGF